MVEKEQQELPIDWKPQGFQGSIFRSMSAYFLH